MKSMLMLGAALALLLGIFLVFWAVVFLLEAFDGEQVLMMSLFAIVLFVGAAIALGAAGALWLSRDKVNRPG